METRFSSAYNEHYDFSNLENQKVIKQVDAYEDAFKRGDTTYLDVAEEEILKGNKGYQAGVKVDSPWGSNTVLSNEYDDTVNGSVQITKKEIVVKPGFMLSLQRHHGRDEIWDVKQGHLTLIRDGERIEVDAGKSVVLPKGSVHCMINVQNEPVTVIETQRGINREADNVRLVDFNGRPTYPIQTDVEFRSAQLYASIQKEISEKFDSTNKRTEKIK